MKKAVVGIMQSVHQAEMLVEQLQLLGFVPDDISVLLPDKGQTKDFAHEHNTKAPEGVAAGVGLGGIAGGALGLLAGLGALTIPGVGLFVAAGPLMGGLSGAAAGAAMGGIAGALIGLGIPEYEAKLYEGKIRGGNILVAAHIEDSDAHRRAEKVFKAAGAEQVSTLVETIASASPHGSQPRAR